VSRCAGWRHWREPRIRRWYAWSALAVVVPEEGAVPQTVDELHFAEVPFSMMLALDTSSSMKGRPLQDLRDGARAAVTALQPDYRVALVLRTDIVVYGATTEALRSGTRPPPPTLQWRSGIRLAHDQPIISSANFLAELAARTGGQFLNAQSAGLRRTFEQIVTDFRRRYVLTYMPTRVSPGGWHPIEVKLKGRSGRVTARRRYQRGA
jgi:hypothetical protein